jgi:hypothetical protein
MSLNPKLTVRKGTRRLVELNTSVRKKNAGLVAARRRVPIENQSGQGWTKKFHGLRGSRTRWRICIFLHSGVSVEQCHFASDSGNRKLSSTNLSET